MSVVSSRVVSDCRAVVVVVVVVVVSVAQGQME